MSEIRVTSIVGENGGDRVGLTTGLTVGPSTGIGATISHHGNAQFTGVCTATTFSGSGANLTNIPDSALSSVTSSKLTGALPAISGANLTGLTAGLFSSYAIICDGNKSSGTNGGQPANTSSYLKRDLNTEIADPDGIVSLSSNQFTLQAGSYYIHAAAPGHRMNQHQARLYNATDGAVVQYGMSAHSSDGNSGNSIAHVYARVTIGGAKAFEIQHRCSNTDGEGFGLANSFGNNQIYTLVEIFKEN